jgi:hypothetical protein
VRRLPVALAAALVAASSAALVRPASAGPASRPPLRGVGLVLEAEEEAAARSSLRALAELRPGLTHVALFVDLHQRDETSPEPARDPLATPSDAAVARTLHEVRKLGLEAVLVPRLRVGGREPQALLPPAWPRWFEGWRRELLHLARLGESAGATLLAVGRTLRQAERQDAEWRETIRQVRGAFSGQLTYVAASERPAGPGWSDLDFVGLSLWEPLAPDSTPERQPSEGELLIAAQRVRDRLRTWRADAKVEQPLLLLEVGFASQEGCAKAPAAAQDRRAAPAGIDLEEQQRCWSATVAAWERVPKGELAGCFAWGWAAPAGPTDGGYSLLGKPALSSLMGWFQQ